MYNCFKELSTDIVFNVLYIYIFFILFYIMYNIHVVKRFRAHCGFYAIENKLLLLLLLYNTHTPTHQHPVGMGQHCQLRLGGHPMHAC